MVTLGWENVCEPAIKYKFSKKLNCWVRTWFTIESKEEGKIMYFQQHNAFSKDKNIDWNKWSSSPV